MGTLIANISPVRGGPADARSAQRPESPSERRSGVLRAAHPEPVVHTPARRSAGLLPALPRRHGCPLGSSGPDNGVLFSAADGGWSGGGHMFENVTSLCVSSGGRALALRLEPLEDRTTPAVVGPGVNGV